MADKRADRGHFYIGVHFNDDRESKCQDDIYSYSEALDKAKRLAKELTGQAAVYLSELGNFTSNRKTISFPLEVWWDDETAKELAREPKRRGYGFYAPEVGRKRWVEYEPDLYLLPPERLYAPEDTRREFEDEGSFTVWGYPPDDSADEKIEESYLSYKEVMARGEQLAANKDYRVSVSEYGTYELNGESESATLSFWWNEEEGKLYRATPVGRGVGMIERDGDTSALVAYVPEMPGAKDESYDQTEEEAEEEDEEEEEYEKSSCEHCGIIKPMYALQEYEREEEVGRSSGSARAGYSSGRRYSSTGRSSHSNRSSVSSSSGRTYYATRRMLLCEDCYAAQVLADRTWTDDLIDWLFDTKAGRYVALGTVLVAIWFIWRVLH